MGRTAAVGVDTGGTFTDLCWVRDGRIHVHKLPSTPDDASRAVASGLEEAPSGDPVVHGTTVATNALLEGRLARTALVTNAGFEDIIEIGRQTRPGIYALEPPLTPAPVPRDLRLGIGGRLGPGGAEIEALDEGAVRKLAARLAAAGVEAVAVGLLHAYADGSHEDAVARILADSVDAVCVSHRVCPEHREYERFTTTVVNAGLMPRVAAYVRRLEERTSGRPLAVMNSAGGTLAPAAAAASPVQTLLSGPAGGVLGALATASLSGQDSLVTLDMGGTSTDVALCPGRLPRASEGVLGGLPLKLPRVDVHTVGAGGGSLARRDAGGALRVGPESAGADPGPACYGRGGTRPTVTDAHVALGRLGTEDLLGGAMTLDRERATEAVAELGRELGLGIPETAEGILRVAGATVERALRVISVERGHDPAGFCLVAFGGAGPLQAAELAASLGIARVLVPVAPGALSALGLVLAAPRRDLAATVMDSAEAVVGRRAESVFRDLEEEGRAALTGEGVPEDELCFERWADVRYRGQSFELTVPFGSDPVAAFHAAHRRRFGLARGDAPVEIVALRVTALGPSPEPPLRERPVGAPDAGEARVDEVPARLAGRDETLSVFDRDRLAPGHRFAGPARIVELSATTVVPRGWEARVDGYGQIHLRSEGAS